jgi:hypothetical protein
VRILLAMARARHRLAAALAGLLVVIQAGTAPAGAGDTGSDVADGVVVRLLDRVRRSVPKAWVVRVAGRKIYATREVLVVQIGNLAGGPDEERPEPRTYAIVLTIGPLLTQAELEVLRKRQRAVEAKIIRLEREMISFACDELESAYRNPCYRPRTRAQQRLVEEDERLRHERIVLPEHFVEKHVSVVVSTDEDRWYEQVTCDDCAQVKAALVGLLDPYEGTVRVR